MKKYFICPDDQQVSIAQCLTQCRMLQRCAPMPYLKACADERPWTGKPSVTQLIKGTREAYLTLAADYAVRPDKEVFALFGTGLHLAMEKYSEEGLTEKDVSIEFSDGMTITGSADYLEPLGNKMYRLIDYKTSGAFKVKKALGMKSQTEKLVNGSKRKTTYIVPEDADMWDWEIQLNMYRIMIERQMPEISIPSMAIFSMVRDGGLKATRDYGVEDNTYLIPVSQMDDTYVLEYFQRKGEALVASMANGTLPEKCTPDECWFGRKCQDYCSVYSYCGGLDG